MGFLKSVALLSSSKLVEGKNTFLQPALTLWTATELCPLWVCCIPQASTPLHVGPPSPETPYRPSPPPEHLFSSSESHASQDACLGGASLKQPHRLARS